MRQLRKIQCVSWILLLIPALVLAQETNYITPLYTKVYGNQIENLPGQALYKELTFNNITTGFGDNDGFMVWYEPTSYKTDGSFNNELMAFYNGGNRILEIYYRGETLMLRRYDSSGISFEYVLFDKMFYYGSNRLFPIFKIYVTSHFIWIEHTTTYDAHKKTHSPIFWGLDKIGYNSSNSNISKFTNRTASGKLRLYENYINPSYTGEDIQIYAFKLSDLVNELQNFANGNFGNTAKLAVEENNDYMVKTLAVEDAIVNEALSPVNGENNDQMVENLGQEDIVDNGTIGVYPNPVKDELFVVLASDKKNTIELMDMQGRLLYQAEVNGTYEHTIPINEHNIGPGIIFLRITTENGVQLKKIIVKE